MEKIRVILSVLAFMLALGAASGFKKVPLTTQHRWIDTSGPTPICRPTSEVCDEGLLPCEKFIQEAGKEVLIYEEDENLVCQPTLTMSGQ